MIHQNEENKEKNKERNGIKETKQDAKGNIKGENNKGSEPKPEIQGINPKESKE